MDIIEQMRNGAMVDVVAPGVNQVHLPVEKSLRFESSDFFGPDDVLWDEEYDEYSVAGWLYVWEYIVSVPVNGDIQAMLDDTMMLVPGTYMLVPLTREIITQEYLNYDIYENDDCCTECALGYPEREQIGWALIRKM